MLRRLHSLILLAGLATFLRPACAHEPASFDRTLSVAGPVVLEVSTGPGGIKVRNGGADHMEIHAVLRPLYGRFDLGLAEESIRALQLDPPVEQAGTHVRIGYTQLERLRMVSMTVEVEVPTGSEIQAVTTTGGISLDGPLQSARVRTSSGHSNISGIEGHVTVESQSGGVLIRDVGTDVAVRTQSGGVQVMGVRGAVDLQSQSGRLEASEAGGEVRATTHSGSINVDNATGTVTAMNLSGSIDAFQLAGAIHAETISGAIHIAQTKPAPIRALAKSGAIHVELAGQQGYTIDAQSRSGKIAGSLVNKALADSKTHRFQQPIAGGGPLVDLDTRSSKIEID